MPYKMLVGVLKKRKEREAKREQEVRALIPSPLTFHTLYIPLQAHLHMRGLWLHARVLISCSPLTQIKESGVVVARKRPGVSEKEPKKRAREEDPYRLPGKLSRGTLYIDKKTAGAMSRGGGAAGGRGGQRGKRRRSGPTYGL
jgi:hypothetical protein